MNGRGFGPLELSAAGPSLHLQAFSSQCLVPPDLHMCRRSDFRTLKLANSHKTSRCDKYNLICWFSNSESLKLAGWSKNSNTHNICSICIKTAWWEFGLEPKAVVCFLASILLAGQSCTTQITLPIKSQNFCGSKEYLAGGRSYVMGGAGIGWAESNYIITYNVNITAQIILRLSHAITLTKPPCTLGRTLPASVHVRKQTHTHCIATLDQVQCADHRGRSIWCFSNVCCLTYGRPSTTWNECAVKQDTADLFRTCTI